MGDKGAFGVTLRFQADPKSAAKNFDVEITYQSAARRFFTEVVFSQGDKRRLAATFPNGFPNAQFIGIALSGTLDLECPAEELFWKSYWATPWTNKEMCPPQDCRADVPNFGNQGVPEVNLWMRVPSFLLALHSTVSGRPAANDGDYAWLSLNLRQAASKTSIRTSIPALSLGIAVGGDTESLLWLKKSWWWSGEGAPSASFDGFARHFTIPAPFPDPSPRTYLRSACERILGVRGDVYQDNDPKVVYRKLNTPLEVAWEQDKKGGKYRLVFRREFGLTGNSADPCFEIPPDHDESGEKIECVERKLIRLEQRSRSLDEIARKPWLRARKWRLNIWDPGDPRNWRSAWRSGSMIRTWSSELDEDSKKGKSSATRRALAPALLAQVWKGLIQSWSSNIEDQSTALFYFIPAAGGAVFRSLPEFDLAVQLQSAPPDEVAAPAKGSEKKLRLRKIVYRVEPLPPKFAEVEGRFVFPALRSHENKPVEANGVIAGVQPFSTGDGSAAEDQPAPDDLATQWRSETTAVNQVAWSRSMEIEIHGVSRSVTPDRVRAGSLDLFVGGKLDRKKKTPCTFYFERFSGFEHTWDTVAPLRLTFYALGREPAAKRKSSGAPSPEQRADESIRLMGRNWVIGQAITLPVAAVTPGESDHNEAETELLTSDGGVEVVEDRPLILVVPPKPATGPAQGGKSPNDLLLELSEIAGATYSRTLELRLKAKDGAGAPEVVKNLKVLYIDRAPFFVGLFALNPITSFKREEGEEAAYWSSRGIFRGWQLRSTQLDFDLILPPQGIGEAMEKGTSADGYHDIEEGQPVDFRFPPPSVLTLLSSDLERRYGGVPWNLRLSLNSLRDGRDTGLPLKMAEFEMLYGLQMRIENAPHLRVAEILTRLGWPRRVLNRLPEEADFYENPGEPGRRSPIAVYWNVRKEWTDLLAAINSRLAIYEVFDSRQAEFTQKGEPAGLMLESGGRNHEELFAALRKSARLRVSMPATAGTESAPPLSNLQPFVTTPGADLDALYEDTAKTKDNLRRASWWSGLIPNYDDGLAGSFAWAFESRLLYESLWADPDPSTPDMVEAAEASLARLYFSALGGWSSQRATFNGGKIVVAVTVEMGRVSELRVEIIGRIGIFWNRAKLVTVFRRSVLPTKQFAEQQDRHAGRPLLRKVEEYVELLEKYRVMKDAATLSVDERLPGCVKAFSCDEKILVDARWGIDVYTTGGQGLGWKVPLRVPGAPKHIYAPANVLIHMHADGAGAQNEVAGRVENLDNLCFWADVRPETSVDSDTWPPMSDIDVFPAVTQDAANPAAPGASSDLTLGTPSVPPVAAQYTFRLAGLDREANLTKHLAPSGISPEEERPVGSMLRNVSVCRGNLDSEGLRPDNVTTKNTQAANEARSSLEGLAGFFEQTSRPLGQGLEVVRGWEDAAAAAWDGLSLEEPLKQKALDFLGPAVKAMRRLDQIRDEIEHRLEHELGYLLPDRAAFKTWFSKWSNSLYPEKAGATFDAFQASWKEKVGSIVSTGNESVRTLVDAGVKALRGEIEAICVEVRNRSTDLLAKWAALAGQMKNLYEASVFTGDEGKAAFARLETALKLAVGSAIEKTFGGQPTVPSDAFGEITAVLRERLAVQLTALATALARTQKDADDFEKAIAATLRDCLEAAADDIARRLTEALYGIDKEAASVSEAKIAAATSAWRAILAQAKFKMPDFEKVQASLGELAKACAVLRARLDLLPSQLSRDLSEIFQNVFTLPSWEIVSKQISQALDRHARTRLDAIQAIWVEAGAQLGVRSECFARARELFNGAEDLKDKAGTILEGTWKKLDGVMKGAAVAEDKALNEIRNSLKGRVAAEARKISDAISFKPPVVLQRVRANISFALRQAERDITGLAAEIAEPIRITLSDLNGLVARLNAAPDGAAELAAIERLCDNLQKLVVQSFGSGTTVGKWPSRLGAINGTLENVKSSFEQAKILVDEIKGFPARVSANEGSMQLRSVILDCCLKLQKMTDRLGSLLQLPWLNGLPSKLDVTDVACELQQFILLVQTAPADKLAEAWGTFRSAESKFSKKLDSIAGALSSDLLQKVASQELPSKAAVIKLVKALGKIPPGGAPLPSREQIAEALAELQQFQTAVEKVTDDTVTMLVGLVSSLGIVDPQAVADTAKRLVKDILDSDFLPVGYRPEAVSQWIEQKREALGTALGRVHTLGDQIASNESIKDAQRALTTWRAFGAVPAVPSLNFRDMAKLGEDAILRGLKDADKAAYGYVQNLNSRIQNVSYIFNNEAKTIGDKLRMSPVVAMVDRVKNAAGEAMEDARLKASSMEMQVRHIGEKIEADIKRIADEGKDTIKDLLPDFGGLKLEKLLGAAGLSERTLEMFKRQTTVTHGFDRQSLSAFVDSKLDNLVLEDSLTVFSMGPVSLRLRNVVLFAHLRVETAIGKETTRQSDGVLMADWDVIVGGRPLLTYEQAALRSVNGSVRMDLDPRKVRMPSILQSVADAMQGFSYSDGSGLQAGVIVNLPKEITGYAKFNLDIPSAAASTSGILNLRISLLFELSLLFPRFPSLRDSQFRISAGAGLSDEEAPFIFSIFILGGCGWFTLRLDYVVPLRDDSPHLEVRVSVGLGVSASLALNLGFARGSVYVALAVQVECRVNRHSSHTRFSIVLTMAGNLSILGIIDVSLLIMLAIRYESPGPMIGEGRIKVRIKICWCFTLKLDRSFTKQFGSSGKSASAAGAQPGLAYDTTPPIFGIPVARPAESAAGRVGLRAVNRRAARMVV